MSLFYQMLEAVRTSVSMLPHVHRGYTYVESTLARSDSLLTQEIPYVSDVMSLDKEQERAMGEAGEMVHGEENEDLSQSWVWLYVSITPAL